MMTRHFLRFPGEVERFHIFLGGTALHLETVISCQAGKQYHTASVRMFVVHDTDTLHKQWTHRKFQEHMNPLHRDKTVLYTGLIFVAPISFSPNHHFLQFPQSVLPLIWHRLEDALSWNSAIVHELQVQTKTEEVQLPGFC